MCLPICSWVSPGAAWVYAVAVRSTTVLSPPGFAIDKRVMVAAAGHERGEDEHASRTEHTLSPQ